MSNPDTDPKTETEIQLEAGGDCPSATCSTSDTPETDFIRAQYREAGGEPTRALGHAERLERERNSERDEIKRLRRVLHAISDSRPDEHMDIEKAPELTTWICETCRKASVGAYPSNSELSQLRNVDNQPAVDGG